MTEGRKLTTEDSRLKAEGRRTGFTLIEMLTVMLIIGIILSISIPAFTNLMKSGGLNSATRQVSNTLSLARQLAITQRMYTRVVFPYQLTFANTLAPRYLSYAVVSVDASGNLIAYLTKWESLPVGVVFLNNPAPGSGSLDNLLISTSPKMWFPYKSGTPSPTPETLAYIEFNPTGVATPLTAGTVTPSVLAITEGFIDNTTFLPHPTTTANTGTLTVDALVGRIQVTR